MHNQFKTQKFKHLMLAMGPRDLHFAPYSPIHCSSHSMTSFQSSKLTKLPVVENSQLFAQRAHSACTAHGTPPYYPTPEWMAPKIPTFTALQPMSYNCKTNRTATTSTIHAKAKRGAQPVGQSAQGSQVDAPTVS